MDLELAKEKLNSLHGKWWFDHQSKKECILGSDGVGHDFIHPADKLEAACRNANGMLSAVQDYWDQYELELISKSRIEKSLKQISVDMDDLTRKEKEIELRRCNRRLENIHRSYLERKACLEWYMEHIEQLLPVVSNAYKDHDDALSHVWLARIAYNASVKSNPLGMEMKIALMGEDEKREAMKLLDCPEGVPVPDANQVMKAIEQYIQGKKELGNGERLLAEVR